MIYVKSLFHNWKCFSLLKIYKKINKFSDVIAYFGTRSWDFKNNNVQTLWRSLDPKDKELFFFDISQLDWDKYFYSYIRGVRQYLVKEDPSTIPQGLKKLRRYVILMFTVRKYIQRSLIAQSCQVHFSTCFYRNTK